MSARETPELVEQRAASEPQPVTTVPLRLRQDAHHLLLSLGISRRAKACDQNAAQQRTGVSVGPFVMGGVPCAKAHEIVLVTATTQVDEDTWQHARYYHPRIRLAPEIEVMRIDWCLHG